MSNNLKIKDVFISTESVEGSGEFDIIVAVLTEDFTDFHKNTISLGIELVPVAQEFVSEVDNGSFKPKKLVDKFKRLFEKYS